MRETFMFFIAVVIVGTVFGGIVMNISEDRRLRMLDEVNNIKVGDLLEDKSECSSDGVSINNPFDNIQYRVIRKRAGWLRLQQVDDTTKIIDMSYNDIVNKKYGLVD